MSDAIKHECGIAMVRLLKPLEFYKEKYGSAFYGINKMYLLMEKQHNRGQDGAGVATIKLDVDPGSRYISRYRSNGSKPIKEIFDKINMNFWEISEKGLHLVLNQIREGALLYSAMRCLCFVGAALASEWAILKLDNYTMPMLVGKDISAFVPPQAATPYEGKKKENRIFHQH